MDIFFFFFSSRRRHTRWTGDWSSDVCSSDLDAVQEAYARAWQRWREVGTYVDPTAWVRTVAYRIAVSSWRRTRNRLLAHQRSESARDPAQSDPDTLALVEVLRKIPAAQRRAIVLHHLVGLPVK